jgi:hypothetical protein
VIEEATLQRMELILQDQELDSAAIIKRFNGFTKDYLLALYSVKLKLATPEPEASEMVKAMTMKKKGEIIQGVLEMVSSNCLEAVFA